MGSKIYVGGLPYSATEQQLSDLFAVHGAVESARIITDKFTGQSRARRSPRKSRWWLATRMRKRPSP